MEGKDRKPHLGNVKQDKYLGSNKSFNSPLEMKQSITTVHITCQGRQHEKKYETRPVKIKYKVKTWNWISYLNKGHSTVKSLLSFVHISFFNNYFN